SYNGQQHSSRLQIPRPGCFRIPRRVAAQFNFRAVVCLGCIGTWTGWPWCRMGPWKGSFRAWRSSSKLESSSNGPDEL
ncbi:hypothetical protein FIBSPDRAFT_852606, partial [Athelia psychrophila]